MSNAVTVRELVVGLGVDVNMGGLARFDDALDRTKAGLQGLLRLAAGAAAVVTGLAVGAVKAAVDTADYAGAHLDAAQAVGVTAEEHQELAHAAKMSGSSIEEVDASLIRLAKTAYEAATGSKTAQAAFRALGVSATDSKGRMKGQVELLEEIADALGRVEPGRRVGMLQDIFGRGGAALIPLLEGGADGIRRMRTEARDLGLVMDEKGIGAAEAFGDQIDKLKESLSGLRNTIGLAFIPVFSDLLSRFEDWWKRNGDMVRAKTHAWAERLADGVERLEDAVKRADPIVKRVFGGWLGLLQAMGAASVGGLVAFAGVKFAMFVGGLIQMAAGLAGVVGGFGTLGVVVLAVVTGVAQLAAGFGIMAFWLVVIVLAVDDFITTLRGGESYLRDFLESIGRWEPLAKTVKEITDALTASWESLTRTWKNIRPALDPILQALRPLGEDLEWLLGLMAKGVGQAFFDKLLWPFQALAEVLDQIATGLGRVEQATGSLSIGALPSADQSGNTTSGIVQRGRSELARTLSEKQAAAGALNLSVGGITILEAGNAQATGDAVRAALRDEVRAARASVGGGSR